MAWKIYSWCFAVVLIAAHILSFIEKVTLLNILDVPISLIALIGLFGFSYKKKITNQRFWQVFIFILICWDILLEYLRGEFSFTSITDIVMLLIVLLITLPEYIALYKYAFSKRIHWDPSNTVSVAEAANDAAPHNP
jgi:hypothetical protein